MKDLKLKATLDVKEIDRIAIGARLYDMLDLSNRNNKFTNNKETGVVTISDDTIGEMIKLVNPGDAKFVSEKNIIYPRSNKNAF